MAYLRVLARTAVVMLAAACSAPSPKQTIDSTELAAVAPLKAQYSGVVMGFDIRDPNTLIVSLDLQSYIEMDDDDVTGMQRNALRRWRSAWSSAHPHARAVLHVRFIDFIGRQVAEVATSVR
jgi:hypothetical protein